MYTLSDSYGYLASLLDQEITSRLVKELEVHKINEKHFKILLAINQYPQFSQKQIASLLGYDRTAMVLLIDWLEELKYAQRVLSKTDRRAYTIKLTVKGQKLLQECIFTLNKLEKEVLSSLEPLELKILKELLIKATIK